ncbi:MAG: hypothetical protein CW691_10075 [Candidatus Bathyarchaeum sp.]|nr:MAG: hypothetical protein CW691_10075 [Candidatus Bathyarchaeum sp.]
MKMNKTKLSNKIRVVSNPKKLKKCPEKRLQFYTCYASAVSETLKKPLFQKFLRWIIKREKIEKKAVKDIQVRMFPFQKENGKSLAGRCNNEGVILIFPKRRSLLKKKLQKHKKEKVLFYLKSRAMAALIHELLHVKYEDNESKVRQLTENYFGIFIRHQNADVKSRHNVQKMLFGF